MCVSVRIVFQTVFLGWVWVFVALDVRHPWKATEAAFHCLTSLDNPTFARDTLQERQRAKANSKVACFLQI